MNIIILTMSAKHGKYCVAGIDVDNGALIRLVSSDEESSGAIDYFMTVFDNRVQCKPLDLVRVPILYPSPLECQPENVLIDDSRRWVLLGQSNLNEMLSIHPLDTSFYVLGSTSYYLNESQAKRIHQSLTIVEVSNLRINQMQKEDGSIKTKSSFNYNGLSYNNMSVTDPQYFYVQDGTTIARAIIVVSIPNNSYMDKWFKFVSKIFPLPHP